MKKAMAGVKNLVALARAYRAISGSEDGIPRMGLLYGFTGAGKSTSVAWLLNQDFCQGVYVRANAVWTPSTMMGVLARECGLEPRRSAAANLEAVIERLSLTGQTLFIDEADYLFRDPRLLDTARDIHDLTGLPVVLIGMDGIDRKLSRFRQLDRRVSERVQFLPLDLEDSLLVARVCCEVEVDRELVEAIHQEAKGSIALVVLGLSQVERFARIQRLGAIGLEAWGDRKLLPRRVA